MFNVDLQSCGGNYGANTYSVQWTPSGDGTLRELIDEINHHYDYKGKSKCNESTIDIYASQKAMQTDWFNPWTSLKIPQYGFLDISNVDPVILDLEVRCKCMIGSWGSDTWYVYFPAHYKLPTV